MAVGMRSTNYTCIKLQATTLKTSFLAHVCKILAGLTWAAWKRGIFFRRCCFFGGFAILFPSKSGGRTVRSSHWHFFSVFEMQKCGVCGGGGCECASEKQAAEKKESKEGRSGILDRKKEKKMEVVEGLN